MIDPVLRSDNGSGGSALIAHIAAAIEIADDLGLDIVAAHLASALALAKPGNEGDAFERTSPTQ